jgi:hypothetical protein
MVVGSRKLRARYYYVVLDDNGNKGSVERDALMTANAAGRIQISSACAQGASA